MQLTLVDNTYFQAVCFNPNGIVVLYIDSYHEPCFIDYKKKLISPVVKSFNI